MRRYIPALLLALAAVAPFPLAGCDALKKLKGGGGDAGGDADAEVASVVAAVDAAPVAEETVDAAAVPVPTTTLTAVPTRPAAVTDAGKTDSGAKPIVDAGTAKSDAGPAPIPTPTFTIPPNLRDLRFDGGALKPPWQK
jgi:hypothetical protein